MPQRRFTSILKPLIVVAALVPVVAIGGPAGAVPSPDARDVSTPDYSSPQHIGAASTATQRASISRAETLAIAADRIDELGHALGFAGQWLDEAAGTITVYWKGEPPAVVRNYAATVTGAKISFVAGRQVSREDGTAAIKRLMSQLSSTRSDLAASVKYDGTGITVFTPAGRPLSATLQTQAATIAGVPVTFETKELPTPVSRMDDGNPFKGGTRIKPTGCSTAFSVLSGATGYLLSAFHCDNTANQYVNNGNNTRQIAPGGDSVWGSQPIDSLVIDPTPSPATTPQIYTGSWNTNGTAVVKNWASNWPNQYVCSDGATSGQNCGFITNDNVWISGLGGAATIEATASGVTTMVAGGDSGGPVFAAASGGVQARGVNYAGSDGVTCGSTNPDVGPQPCFRKVYYMPISVILRSWGYSLEVG